MKKSTSKFFTICFAILVILSQIAAKPLFAQKEANASKIGVYDSRIVVFAYSRSNYFREYMMKIKVQSDSASSLNDSIRIKEMSIKAMSYQHLLHQMVFGNGSAISVMDLIKDRLPDIAEQAEVKCIISKYELNYIDPSVEIVDLTNHISQLFNPNENIEDMAREISKNQPIPLEDLSISADMLDQYSKRFGKH